MQQSTTSNMQQQIQHLNGQLGNYKMKFAESASANLDLQEQIRNLSVERQSITTLLAQVREDMGAETQCQALNDLFGMLPPIPVNEPPMPDAEPEENAKGR